MLTFLWTRRSRALALTVCLVATLTMGVTAPAQASTTWDRPPEPVELTPPDLTWADCDDGFQCATMTVPLDFAHPEGGSIDLSLVRKPATDSANRIGSMLTNPGGPGGSGVDFVRATAVPGGLFEPLNERFDIVGWDPRGTKASAPIDCQSDADQDEANNNFKPFPDRGDRDAVVATARAFIQGCLDMAGPALLESVSTLNTARDMELIRLGLGEDQISYLGFSYGTYLGATYATLYPESVRAFVLDGALNPRQYARRPILSGIEQAAGFELAFDRFFESCEQTACRFGGGKDAWRELVNSLEANPLATGIDPSRPVNGATAINASIITMYVRQWWPILDQALFLAANGDGRLLQILSDVAIGRNDDGSYDPGSAAFPAITAIDQDYPSNIRIQDRLYRVYNYVSPSFGPSTFWASIAGGYSAFEWPVRANARFDGPFRFPRGTTPILVIGTTFDPATPYAGSIALTRQLRNARLLTMDGDGHTAYGGNSSCIDDAVDRYLQELAVPDRGTVCDQELPALAAAAAQSAESATSDEMMAEMTSEGELETGAEALARLGIFATRSGR